MSKHDAVPSSGDAGAPHAATSSPAHVAGGACDPDHAGTGPDYLRAGLHGGRLGVGERGGHAALLGLLKRKRRAPSGAAHELTTGHDP